MSSDGARLQRSSLRFGGEALTQVAVRIGDVKVAGGTSLLFTIGLGSCVAVALHDARARLGGMAHAMLPRPESGYRDGPEGRFASLAVPQLIAQLVAEGAALERLRARLAGGAAMFPDLLDRDGLQLGRRNVEAARAALEAAGIPIDGEDVYGSWGRSVFLRTDDGALLVTSVSHGDVIL
jgi:chemotaxis protein CheD